MMERSQSVPAKDVAWLLEQMERNRISQRTISRATGLDASSLSRSFAGQRQMKMEEFAEILAYVESIMPRMETPMLRAFWSSRLTMVELSRRTKLSIPRLHNLIQARGEPMTSEEEARMRGALNGFRSFENLTSAGPETRGNSFQEEKYSDNFAAPVLDVLAAPVSLGGGFYRKVRSKVEERERPQMLVRVPGSYAFFVGDEGLQPRWYPGEVLFVHPGQPALERRWMIASLSDDRILIGQMLSSEGSTVRLDVPGTGIVGIGTGDVIGFEAIVGAWST